MTNPDLQPTFVAIQATYTNLGLALFCQGACVAQVNPVQARASSHIVPLIDRMLYDNSVGLHELSFLAVDKGPGAFTSLRVAIATVNGLAFGNGVPLLGVSGLEALAWQTAPLHNPGDIILCILNAYNNDVYYGLYHVTSEHGVQALMPHGCGPIGAIATLLQPHMPKVVVGNAVTLHQQALESAYPQIILMHDLVLPSAQQIGLCALRAWHAGQVTETQIVPEYLKTQLFAIRN